MNTTSPATPLTRFREQLYRCFGMRRDALFEVLDAVVTAPQIESLVGLSLAPGFARGWASTCDALSDGSLEVPAIQRLLAAQPLPQPEATTEARELWALDGSTWPRPTALTSPERTVCRVLTAGSAGQSLVDGWEYQWLVVVPEDAGSWVLPLAVDRRSPTAGTATTLAIAQVRAVQDARAAAQTAAGSAADSAAVAEPAPRPILLLDSSYAVGQLVAADLGVDILARLASHRVFRRPAPPWKGIGRVPRHGPPFKLADPSTHGPPDATTVVPDPVYGAVTIDRWDRLHDERSPDSTVSLVRLQLAHYAPRAHRQGAPQPLWLVWTGDELPARDAAFRAWYLRRFAIEHAFRFLKQSLGWTTPHLRHPEAADRWSWVLALALWQLWLAREAVVPVTRPWERPRPVPRTPVRPTPGQVRRGCASLFAALGTPARPPQRRGNAPGRQRGQCPGRAPRYPVVKRGPPPAPPGSRAPP